jgi:hypothetical protein
VDCGGLALRMKGERVGLWRCGLWVLGEGGKLNWTARAPPPPPPASLAQTDSRQSAKR